MGAVKRTHKKARIKQNRWKIIKRVNQWFKSQYNVKKINWLNNYFDDDELTMF